MSTTLRTVATIVTMGAALSTSLRAQVSPSGPPQLVGRMRRENCVANDSTRTFRRGVGQDSSSTAAPAPGAPRLTGGTPRSHEYPEYDVVLDIPDLCVEKVYLKVDTVTAHLALTAQVANLLRVNAGADVMIGNVDLTIQGVRAKALLLVDLDDVVHAVDQTLTLIDNHPEIADQLTGTIANAAKTAGGVVNALLLGATRNAAGQLVERLVDPATGALLERVLNSAGQSIDQRSIGSITSLPQVSRVTNAAGQVVRRVRDQSGAIIEYVQEGAGKLSNIHIVQQ